MQIGQEEIIVVQGNKQNRINICMCMYTQTFIMSLYMLWIMQTYMNICMCTIDDGWQNHSDVVPAQQQEYLAS